MAEHHPTPAGQPVLILGMHRSGTSFLANALQGMGVHIGDELLPGNEGNPRGHFEATRVLDFHTRALDARAEDRARFFDTGIYREAPLRFVPTQDELNQAEEIIRALARPGLWGWKEPRTCLFVDFWFKRLPQAKGVLIYRHPLEVFVSLVRRKDWEAVSEPALVFNTYATYNEELLRQFRENPERMLVISDAAFEDLPAMESLLHEFLGDKLKPLSAQFHSKEYRRLPISARLEHLVELFHPRAMRSYRELQALSRIPRRITAEAPADLEPIYKSLEIWAEGRSTESLQEMHSLLESLIPGVPEGFFHQQRRAVMQGIRRSLTKSKESLEDMVEQRDLYIEKFNNYFDAYTALSTSFEGARKWAHEVLLPRIKQLETWLWDLGYDPETGKKREGE